MQHIDCCECALVHRFMLDRETSQYKYYKLDAPDDGAFVLWKDNLSYGVVF